MQVFRKYKKVLFLAFVIVLFLLSVIFSGSRRNSQTNLKGVNEIPNTNNNNSNFTITEREPIIIDESTQETKPDTSIIEDLLDNKPAVIFVFTNEGWTPTNKNVVSGSLIKWTNLTNQDIYVRELIAKNTPLKETVIIKPNESFQAVIEGLSYWTFKELVSGEVGRLYLYPKK